MISSSTPVRYLDAAAPWARKLGIVPTGERYQAGLAMRVRLLFDETRADLRHTDEWEAVLFPFDADPRPADARPVDFDERDFRAEPLGDARYILPDAPIQKADFFRGVQKDVKEHLLANQTITLMRNEALKLYSRAGESEDDFLARCEEAAEDRADEDASKLRDRYAKRLDTARDRKADAERRVRELEVDVGQRKQQELVAGAGDLLSMFLGGRRRVRSLSGAASRRSTTRRTQERLRSAEEKLDDYDAAIQDLEDELAEELEEIWTEWKDRAQEIDTLEIGLEKTDITVEDLLLFWAPVD